MSFRIATFNVESMFERPKALNLETWADGRQILNDCAELNDLVGQQDYTAARKTRMLTLMDKYPPAPVHGEERVHPAAGVPRPAAQGHRGQPDHRGRQPRRLGRLVRARA